MKKILLIFGFLFLFSTSLTAAETRVFDKANLLDSAQIEQLEEQIQILQNEYDIDIVLLTTNDTQGKSSLAYAEDFYDASFPEDGMIMLIDMQHREVQISFSGSMLSYFTDDRQEQILDEVTPNLKDGNYFTSFSTFLTKTQYFIDAGVPENQYFVKEKTLMDRVIWLGMALVVAIPLAFLVSYFLTKRKTKVGRNITLAYAAATQLNSSTSLDINQDQFINAVTTKVYVEPPRPSSGGSSGGSHGSGRTTTHTSSSGRTHSSSGRGF